MFVGPGTPTKRSRSNRARVVWSVGIALIAVVTSRGTIADPPPTASHPEPVSESQADPNDVPPASPEVTIQSHRALVAHQAAEFVHQATRNPRFRDESLPRWNAPVCFAVGGLSTNEGTFALGRLREIARRAGVPVVQGRCKYNFIVVFAPQPDGLLKKAFRRQPRALDRCQGMPEIENFLSPPKPRPVRVWHNVRLFSRDGTPIGSNPDCGSIGIDKGDFPVSLQFSASRIERYDVFAFSLALVVIDTAYPAPLKLRQLVDYAALVGLADISVDANFGDAPTVLRIFEQPTEQRAGGLTPWDEAFLSALYHSDPATVTQRSQIAVKMTHDIVP
jgi:hypothetical protein